MSNILDEGLAALDRQLGIEPGTEETATVAETTEQVATEAAEQETTERARDEAGRFAKAEPEATTDGRRPERTEEERFADYLGRFGADPAALAELPVELQKTIRAGFEADGMTGRQGRELGQLKQALDELRESVEASRPEPQPVQQQGYDPDAVADHFAEHPTSILPTIQQAYANEDMNLVYLGIAALEDIDRPLAEGLRIEIAKRAAIAEMAPQIERNVQADFNTTFTAAWNTVKADHPDIDQFADQILAAAQADPETLRGLQEGTPETTARVIGNLYKIAAFDASRQDGTTLTEAAAKSAAEQAAEADAAKREGFVATGNQRVESKQEPEDPILAIFDKAAARYMAPAD